MKKSMVLLFMVIPFVKDATMEELAQIFSTAETRSEVRAEWPNEAILRFIPGTDSGTFDYFVGEVFDKESAPILSAANLQPSKDDNILVQGIKGSPYAIGFFDCGYYAEIEASLNILRIDVGYFPANDSALDGAREAWLDAMEGAY